MAEEQTPRERGITKIGVKGFKSIVDDSIEIRPLTILAGANSSGKSSIMQPLLLLKQTLDSDIDRGVLRTNGLNVNLPAPSEWFTRIESNTVDTFELEIELHRTYILKNIYSIDIERLKIVSTTYSSPDYSNEDALIFSSALDDIELVNLLPQEFHQFRDAMNVLVTSKFEWTLGFDKCFLIPELVTRTQAGIQRISGDVSYRGIFADELRRLASEVIHVPKIRLGSRSYEQIRATGPQFPGTFDIYVPNFVETRLMAKGLFVGNSLREENRPQDYISPEEDYYLNRRSRLVEMLKDLNLTKTIGTRTTSDNKTEIIVGSKLVGSQSIAFNIADVGFGVSQVLPVLVALLVAEPGQLVYIEQPELHLHPRAQHKLAEFIAEAANRGVRVVIETHSDLLLRGIQTAVVRNDIAPEKVILHWFKRNQDGMTQIKQGYLDVNGAYGDFPVDFSDVDFDADGEYLDEIAKRRTTLKENG